METNNIEGSAQPADLFAYIGGQQPQAVDPDDALVTQLQESAPTEVAPPEPVENVTQVAATADETPPATPGQPTPPDAEAARYQQRIQELEQRESRNLAAIALIANQAKQREATLFEQSLAGLTDEDADAARRQREFEQTAQERDYLRSQFQTMQTRQNQAQEHVDKTNVAHALLQRLGLPGEDRFVMAALMDSASPAEMIAAANRLATVFRGNQQQAAAATAQQAAQTGVHNAGGENAPAVVARKTPERSGELIDMMRERQYVAE